VIISTKKKTQEKNTTSNYIQSRLFDLTISVKLGPGVRCSGFGKDEIVVI